MQRESRLGRALWIAVVVVLGGYVVADFVRSPFLAPSGSAAVRSAQLTLWVPAGESGGETGIVVDEAAAALELHGHTTAVKNLTGGSSQAVAEFLSRPPREHGANLLVVTSATLADLAHDRRDRLVPGAAEQAALARELLRRASPLGILESNPLALAVSPGSGIEDPGQLLTSMREAPWERFFAIADDTWSRVQLAALVNQAGVDGHIRFSVFQSGGEAGQAVAIGGANTALATRGALREDVSAGRLRELTWPIEGRRPPRSWVALVSRPALSPARVAQLRGWVAGLARDRQWRAQLRREGRYPGNPGSARLADLLRSGSNQADRLELLAQRVERR